MIDFVFTGTTAQLTALIDAWLVDNVTNAQANPGLLLLQPGFNVAGPDIVRMNFHTRVAADAGDRPKLIVTYTAIPVPAGLLLLAAVGIRLKR